MARSCIQFQVQQQLADALFRYDAAHHFGMISSGLDGRTSGLGNSSYRSSLLWAAGWRVYFGLLAGMGDYDGGPGRIFTLNLTFFQNITCY
jgi:hypothetical protein